MQKNIICALSLIAAPASLLAMGGGNLGSSLPRDLDWPIMEQIVRQTAIKDIPRTIQQLMLTSKQNLEFINKPATVEKMITILNLSTKNKVRAAELINTKTSKAWLENYLKTEEGKKAFAQARKDEQDFAGKPASRKGVTKAEVEDYIDKGGNVNVRWGKDGFSLLSLAFMHKKLEMADLLLKHPSLEVNALLKNGRTYLTDAIYSNDKEAIQRLLKVPNSNINKVTVDGTALDIAIKEKRPKLIELIKQAGGKTAAEVQSK